MPAGWRSLFRPPPTDPLTVRLIISSESSPQCGLLVQHDKQVRDGEEQARIAEEPNRLIKERGTSQRKAGTNVHRIPDESIWTPHHEPTRRIERRRSPPADEHKREDTRERKGCAGGPQKHPGNLPGTDSRRWLDACRGQDPARKKYKEEADEERRISDRASEDEHLWHSHARSELSARSQLETPD